jgi:hypothetical protein
VAIDSREDEATDVASANEFDLADVAKMITAIQKLDAEWKQPKKSLGLTPADWRPHLVAEKRACHVHAVSILREHWTKRMAAAKKKKRQVTIAAPLSCWYTNETILAADELDAAGIVLRPSGKTWQAKGYNTIVELVAEENLIVAANNLQLIGRKTLERARVATDKHVRGRLFERFLCLLFSQISDFELFEHNYRTETEEIDGVFLNRRVHGRCWPSSPVVLLSGKNTKGGAGAPAVTSLAAKMKNRRGMCKLGFLCSSNSISNDARNHELRYSHEEGVMVLLDGKDLDGLLDKADQLEAELERLVVKASLR